MKCFTKTKGKDGQWKVFIFYLKDIEGYEGKFISYKDDDEHFFQMIQTRMMYKSLGGK